MSDDLIEKIARAIWDAQHPWAKGAMPHGDISYRIKANAALSAIEESGTHVVAPLNADGQMVGEWLQSQASGQSIETGYYRMLSARPPLPKTEGKG